MSIFETLQNLVNAYFDWTAVVRPIWLAWIIHGVALYGLWMIGVFISAVISAIWKTRPQAGALRFVTPIILIIVVLAATFGIRSIPIPDVDVTVDLGAAQQTATGLVGKVSEMVRNVEFSVPQPQLNEPELRIPIRFEERTLETVTSQTPVTATGSITATPSVSSTAIITEVYAIYFDEATMAFEEEILAENQTPVSLINDRALALIQIGSKLNAEGYTLYSKAFVNAANNLDGLVRHDNAISSTAVIQEVLTLADQHREEVMFNRSDIPQVPYIPRNQQELDRWLIIYQKHIDRLEAEKKFVANAFMKDEEKKALFNAIFKEESEIYRVLNTLNDELDSDLSKGDLATLITKVTPEDRVTDEIARLRGAEITPSPTPHAPVEENPKHIAWWLWTLFAIVIVAVIASTFLAWKKGWLW